MSRRSNEANFSRGFAKEVRKFRLFRCVTPVKQGRKKENKRGGVMNKFCFTSNTGNEPMTK